LGEKWLTINVLSLTCANGVMKHNLNGTINESNSNGQSCYSGSNNNKKIVDKKNSVTKGDNETVKGNALNKNAHVPSIGRYEWKGTKCDLVDYVEAFVAKGELLLHITTQGR